MKKEEVDRLLRFWLAEGFKFRLADSHEMQADTQKYKARMQMEWAVISSIPGYVDYFAMVSDLVRWAKDQGILVGPGRGSAASSLCCWFLRITEIDPLLYPMLFERFISPDRPDLPDVDIDFEDERRGEVIAYAQEKYGMDRVANILNFVRYKGRNSLDDVARAYEMPGWKTAKIKAKLVERSEGHPRFADTLEDTIASDPELQQLVQNTPELMYASRLEGNIRNSSIHPCGIVIGGTNLNNVCASYEKQSGKDRGSGVAYDKKDTEYLGLLKVDFLSLTTLSAIRASLDALNISIDEFYRLPLNDPKVFEAFRAGDVLGIFQFEGYTTKRVLKTVKPTKFMDLVDVNALSRPGGDNEAYVKAKDSGVLPEVNDAAGQHLNWTYGTIVYQEQILLILRDYGNFPTSDVNAVRKIISGKQDESILNEYFQRFAEGAASHGDTEEQAQEVWGQILAATGYAFCVTGDTLVERCGAGGHPTGYEPTVSVRQLYEWQQTRTKTGLGGNAAYCMGHKIRRGDLRLLGMDDDGRIRPNQLERIHDPVPVRCKKITTESGKTLTCSNDHRLLTSQGYKLALLLEVGDQVVMDMGHEAREQERVLEHTVLRQTGYKKHDGSNSVEGQHNPAYIDGRTALRDNTFQEVWVRDEAKCQHCGKAWDGTSHGLEFAHMMTLEFFEGDYRKYHDLKNITLLCNSCHKKYDYRVQGTRQKRWSRGRPTGLETVVSIEEAGIQEVYDISMVGEPHNYLGNGFINHNNISHAACYSDTAYRQMWLKVYHPEFYLGLLLKCPTHKEGLDRRRQLVVEAEKHGIKVQSVNLALSQRNWSLHDRTLTAGWEAIHKIGPALAGKIVKWRDSKPNPTQLNWDDLGEVSGIGPARVRDIQAFAENDDPFDVLKLKRLLDKVRDQFARGEFNNENICTPNCLSTEIKPYDYVTFLGRYVNSEERNIVVRRQSFKNKGPTKQGHDENALTEEEILNDISNPQWPLFARVWCKDEHSEDSVAISIPRTYYNVNNMQMKRYLATGIKGESLIVVTGEVQLYKGNMWIQADKFDILSPDTGD